MPLLPVSTDDPHVSAHNEEREAINNLETDLGDRISKPANPKVGDLLRWDGNDWVTSATRLFEGEGSPEGVVAAPIGSRYVDTAVGSGAIEWIKRSGVPTSNTGWILSAFADTGWRDVTAQIIAKAGYSAFSAKLRRVGDLVDIFFDLQTPNASGNWAFYNLPLGFRPAFDRYGLLHDNKENASTSTLVNAAGVCSMTCVKGAWRDRWNGQWSTTDPWPAALPGS